MIPGGIIYDNLDIVNQHPPAVLWGFNCSGQARPQVVSSGSMHAMLVLHNEGRILELHAYRYLINQLLFQHPEKPAFAPLAFPIEDN